MILECLKKKLKSLIDMFIDKNYLKQTGLFFCTTLRRLIWSVVVVMYLNGILKQPLREMYLHKYGDLWEGTGRWSAKTLSIYQVNYNINFSRKIPGFIHRIKVIIIFTVLWNTTSCSDVSSWIACIMETCLKTKENVINKKNQWFWS